MGNTYGYVRVSTREQNEVRQLIALNEARVPGENIYVVKMRCTAVPCFFIRAVYFLKSDIQQIAVCLQRALRIMGKHFLGQNLAKLNPIREPFWGTGELCDRPCDFR